MSSSFSGSNTKSISKFEREVETKLAKLKLSPTDERMLKIGYIYKYIVKDEISGRSITGYGKTKEDAITSAKKHNDVYKIFNNETDTRELKHLDIFTEDFSPPGTAEWEPGMDFNKSKNNYQDRHTDGTKKGFPESQGIKNEMAAAGRAKDQPGLDRIDKAEQKIEAPIKKEKDQFPGSLLERNKKMAEVKGPESFHKEIEKRMKSLAGVDGPQSGGIHIDIDSHNDEDEEKHLSEGRSKEVQDYEADVAATEEGLPGNPASWIADEGLWDKAKDASKQALGKVKYGFVVWWYLHHGGKKK